MTITINKIDYTIPGLNTLSWKDGISWIKYITDKSPRIKTIKNIVLHTNEGLVSKLLPGIGPNSTIDETLARYQVNTDRDVSWDYTVDSNGDVIGQNDPAVDYSWQAGNVNPSSLGIEMVQQNKEGIRYLYEEQMKKVVLLVDFLTASLGIQRQIAWDKINNKPVLTQISRIINFKDFIGVTGHVQWTRDRGKGDPGEHIFNALKEAGYECFDLSLKEDLEIWKQRQKDLSLSLQDGIPGKETVAALKAKGHKNGMWVQRPIDQQLNF